MRLEGKVAIVTGAARGIGLETARVFAREGARVVLADYDQESGREALEIIENEGGEAVFIKVDVVDTASVEALVEETLEKYQHLDILVNNAGVTADNWLVKMDEQAWDKVIDVNLKGVFNCSRIAARVMMEQGKGVILNASSVVGLYGNLGQSNYAASKFGVIGLTRTWAKELGPRGVRVNAVAPGYVNTRMLESVPEKVLKAMAEKTPLKRLGEVEDIANAYLYLASDEASYVNGTVLSVDGGLVLG